MPTLSGFWHCFPQFWPWHGAMWIVARTVGRLKGRYGQFEYLGSSLHAVTAEWEPEAAVAGIGQALDNLRLEHVHPDDVEVQDVVAAWVL